MAGFAAVVIAVIVMGVLVGAFFKLSFAIRREDRNRGSLRFDAPSHSAQTARALVGMTSSRWN